MNSSTASGDFSGQTFAYSDSFNVLICIQPAVP
jgi:hypothetical protein